MQNNQDPRDMMERKEQAGSPEDIGTGMPDVVEAEAEVAEVAEEVSDTASDTATAAVAAGPEPAVHQKARLKEGNEKPPVYHLPEGTQNYTEEDQDKDIMGSNKTYAGFFVRLTAYLLDRLFLVIPLGILRLIFWFMSTGKGDHLLTKDIFFRFSLADMILYALTVGYFIVFTYITGRTIGKRIMRLKVVSVEERKPTLIEIIYRETFGRFLSGIVLCIGYFMIIIGDEKEALHDYLADTRVIYR